MAYSLKTQGNKVIITRHHLDDPDSYFSSLAVEFGKFSDFVLEESVFVFEIEKEQIFPLINYLSLSDFIEREPIFERKEFANYLIKLFKKHGLY